ncbi:helix-turn-helix domain-containing protein [Streptomyces sp. NBRC 109706]|uniref:helix-turn-helix domain-containing protein n=1 Tax=Streptomyces sp. NBRC 109706 TaxID=1550035 RepID=UPI000780C2DB|nr:helix-turn-helix domain-containing protein [Streptomyces sp. NBRC 109706]
MSNGNDKAKDRPSVGRTLQQARIDAKLTVDEVSSATRVRIPIVQAIENDDFSRCGGDVYARGHIRTLARAVGLDAAELIELYNVQQDAHPPSLSSGPLFEAERIRPEPRRPNWTAAMVAAIAVVIGFVGFTFFSPGDDEDGGGSVAERTETPGADSPGGEGPEKNGPEVPTPTEAPSESAVAGVPADKVTVRLSIEGGNSWISAKDSNGRLLFEGVLEDGDSETFTDDERIDLVLGNAGAVKLHVNGSEIEDVFEPGQVQRLSYTLGDPEEG